MSEQKAPYLIRIIIIAITLVLAIIQIILNFEPEIQILWWLLCVLFFPIVLYVIHLCIPVNIKRSYFLALLVDAICFLVPFFLYHLLTAFIYWDDAETILVGYLMALVKLYIIIVFAIIYFVVSKVKKKKKVLQ